MDPIDFAIYRFLSEGGEARFWAGRRAIDPRATPRVISEKVGVSESGVRGRLRRLSQQGFLRDRTVVPNPSLFDHRLFVADLLVRQSREVDRILRDLALVDGVVFTRDILDEDERKIEVHFVAENDASATRRAALIGRLSQADRTILPRPYYIPPHASPLSAIDWRVLKFLWQQPEATLAEIGKAAQISLKSAARSFHRLLEGRGCWWTHGPRSEEFPLALVWADLARPEVRESVLEWIDTAHVSWMPVARDGFGLEPERSLSVVAGLVPADVPTALERHLRGLAGLEGVTRARRTFALGSAVYPNWFGERLSTEVAHGRR